MSQMKASDFDPRVLKLFDGYVHGIISRRNFLDRAAAYTVGGVTAAIPATNIERAGFLVTSIGEGVVLGLLGGRDRKEQ